MEANELRIGNWIKWKFTGLTGKANAVISQNAKDGILYLVQTSDGFSYLIDHLEPIPLTHEILGKTNLVRDTEHPYSESAFAFNSIEESPFHCYWDGEKITYLGVVIKNLHQLQNLYFALTGEELEVNL